MKTYFNVFGFILALLVSSSSMAAAPVYTSLFSSNAIGGYDATSYFDEGKAVKGSKKYQTKYKGAVWSFKSAANLAKFKANPQHYAPQYGGYCAWAVGAKKELVSGDPKQWTIYKNKLYINYDKAVKNKWLKNKAGFVQSGNKNFPSLIK